MKAKEQPVPAPTPAPVPTRADELNQERDALRARLDVMVRAAEARRVEIIEAGEELERISARPEPDADRYAALSARRDALRKLQGDQAAHIENVRQAIEDVARERERLKGERDSLRRARAAALSNLATFERRIVEARDAITNMQERIESTGGEVASIDARLATFGEL